MGVLPELIRGELHEALLDLEWRLAVRQSGAIRNAEYMRVDSDCRLTKSGVQDHVGRLSSDARQRFECRSEMICGVADLPVLYRRFENR